MTSRNVLCSFTTVCCCLLVFGCSPKKQAAPAAAAQAEEVIIDRAADDDVQLYIYADGLTKAFNSVTIRARVAGYLEKQMFPSGSLVKQGEQIALIEQAQYQIALDAAKADLVNCKARAELAAANYERGKILFSQNASTKEELQSRKAEKDMADASVKLSETAVRNAELNLEYTVVKTPYAGKMSHWNYDVGNYVATGSDSQLVHINQLNPIYVDFKLSDRQFIDLKNRIGFRQAFDKAVGRQVESSKGGDGEHPLTLTGGNADISLMTGVNVLDFDFNLTGKIISQIDDQINADSGQITLRVQLDNPLLDINGSQDHMLYPGQICRVRIPYEKVKNAVLVREEAVLTDLDTKYVLLVTKGKYQPADKNGAPLKDKDGKVVPAYETDIVQRRDIRIGRLLDNQMRIVEGGLKHGEEYVVKGVQRVRIGMAVAPVTLEEYNKRREAENKAE